MNNYEDKYKAALGWMRSLYKGLHGATKEDAEHYFPELTESEGETIRKVLIDYFNQYKGQDTCGSETFNGIPTDSIIAWLGKQGKKLDADEVIGWMSQHICTACFDKPNEAISLRIDEFKKKFGL